MYLGDGSIYDWIDETQDDSEEKTLEEKTLEERVASGKEFVSLDLPEMNDEDLLEELNILPKGIGAMQDRMEAVNAEIAKRELFIS